MPASINRWPRCSIQSRAGATLDNQSTTWPSMLNNSASNTPMNAVNRVMAPI